jgi:hypothetical protein
MPSMRTLALLALLPLTAVAQEQPAPEAAGVMSTPSSGGSQRHMANTDWMIPPAGDWVLGGSLTFLTADVGPGDRALDFTDVVMFGVHSHLSIKGRVEVSLGTTLLPKKPEWTDENPWQGSSAGLRVGFGKRYAAWLRGAGGPNLGENGWWGAATAGFQARKSIHETIVFQGSVGGLGTRLWLDEPNRKAWLAEVGAVGEMIFRTPRSEVAFWLGTQLWFPVASEPTMLVDPETRVSFHLGLILAFIPEWDIATQVVWNDRGDSAEPATELPILDGGFDQTQLTFSISRRFGRAEYERDREIHLAR